MFRSVGSDYRTALQIFFEEVSGWLGVTDPAGHSGTLNDYLTYASRQALLSRLDTANQRAKNAIVAETNGDHAEAKRLWSVELGSEFPLS